MQVQEIENNIEEIMKNKLNKIIIMYFNYI